MLMNVNKPPLELFERSSICLDWLSIYCIGSINDTPDFKFTLLDLYSQLEQMNAMGSMDKLLSMVPGMGGAMAKIPKSELAKQEKKMAQWKSAISSMTEYEIENPEIAQKRMRELYKAKGYSDAWIEKRVRGIAIRDELTSEWDKRDIETDKEYSILTAEISKATFGLTPSEYKKVKGLKRENLRDHMGDLELIFSMLGEASTTRIARDKDAQGFAENKSAAKEGGAVAGTARKELEKQIKGKVVSKENYLEVQEKQKRLEKK